MGYRVYTGIMCRQPSVGVRYVLAREAGVVGDLPTGTLTLLFTDIEGSTMRWQQDREAMALALAAHDDVLGTVVEGRGGQIFKHTGDGVCAVFGADDPPRNSS